MTAEDLRTYFQGFGEVTDVFVPKPFRAFAFVTFTDPDVAQSLCGDDHIIKGTSVHLSCATPKSVERYTDKLMQTGRGFGGYSGFGKGGDAWVPDTGRGKPAGSGFSGGGSYGVSGGGMGGGNASQFQLNPAMMAAAQAAFAQGLLGMMNMNPGGGGGGGSGGYGGGGYGPGSSADATAKPVPSGGGGSSYGNQAGSGDTQTAAGGYSGTQMPASNYGNTGSNQGYGGWTPAQQTDSHGSSASWGQPRPPAPGWN